MARRIILAAVAAALVASCAHQIILTPRSPGMAGGSGAAPATLVSYHGNLSLNLDGQAYAGQWDYLPDAGSLTLLNTTAVTPAGGVVTGVATGVSTPTGGGGLALLTAPDGKKLRCEFRWSDMSYSGLGVCQRSDGELYDMVIR